MIRNHKYELENIDSIDYSCQKQPQHYVMTTERNILLEQGYIHPENY